MGFESKLVPIRIADCDRPGLLAQIVSFDLFGHSEQAAAERLLEQVAMLRAGRAKPPTSPPFPGPAPSSPRPQTTATRAARGAERP